MKPASMQNKTLGANFRQALNSYGFSTLKEAAKAVGWNTSLIRERCSGKTNIKIIDILEIAQVVENVDPMVFLARIINAENPSVTWEEKEIDYLTQLLKERIVMTTRMSHSNSATVAQFQNKVMMKLTSLKETFNKNKEI